MLDRHKRIEFEHVVLPHLDAAHNLARWLIGHPHDAQELTQDAVARAFRFFETYRGGDARAWLLRIVRNTCYDWLGTHRKHPRQNRFDEEHHSEDGASISAANVAMGRSPEEILLHRIEGESLQRELAGLPVQFREALILRELEGLSYQEISAITDVPPGTVMSRLSRARRMLQERLAPRKSEEPSA